MKILYVAAVSNQVSGGTAVMSRNLNLIRNISGVNVEEVQIPMQSKVSALIAALTGGNFILSSKDEKEILNKVRKEGCDYLFLEGTSSGHFVEQLSKTKVKTIVFAHNVETMLYEERMNSYRFNPIEAIKYLSISRNEKKSVKYCTNLITLTKRDKENFLKRFGRNSDLTIPISFDSMIGKQSDSDIDDSYCLFVGSNFFPNIEGMNWFINNVVPKIKLKVKVVGTCCNSLNPIPENMKEKVEYLGLVDDLKSLYQNASIVIAPIFKGSGMKTKTVEAMSYGKTIMGTDECFQGIECDYSRIGCLCNTADEFITAINNYNGGKLNSYTAELFESKFSTNAVQPLFKSLFNS